jgi:hypothetical protein
MSAHYETHSAIGAAAITPSNTVDIAMCRGIIVATSGYVKGIFKNGDTAEFYAAAGVVIPVCLTRIYATTVGTAATGIVALY